MAAKPSILSIPETFRLYQQRTWLKFLDSQHELDLEDELGAEQRMYVLQTRQDTLRQLRQVNSDLGYRLRVQLVGLTPILLILGSLYGALQAETPLEWSTYTIASAIFVVFFNWLCYYLKRRYT